MVINLGLCRSADAPLPEDVPFLACWDEQLLELRNGSQYFTPASDLYQISLMLSKYIFAAYMQLRSGGRRLVPSLCSC